MDLRFTTAGFIVGSLVGATGVGGGSLMTPILMLFFNVPAGSAVGTDLLFASITKGVGTGLHGLNQSISWRVVTRLAIGSIPASLGTLWLLHNVINPKSLSAILTTTLGVALVVTSLAIFFQPLLRKLFRKEAAPTRFTDGIDEAVEQQRMIAEEAACESRPESAPLTVFTGFLLGVMVTMTSVGSGALGVMVLMALYPKVRSVRIVGTDIAHAVPLTLVAGLGHASTGVVDYDMLGSLLLGSIPGIALGSHVAFRLPEKALKRTLALILLFVGSRLVMP
jgi:uncharacterized membrane protein YfcA